MEASKKPNAWILHVKKYAEEKKIPYGQAVYEAKATYTKQDKPAKASKKAPPVPTLDLSKLAPPPLVKANEKHSLGNALLPEPPPKVRKPRAKKPVVV